jgi:hypothetical protein
MIQKNGTGYFFLHFFSIPIRFLFFFETFKIFVIISTSQVSLICCVSAILADQLPHPLQLFYLTPNNVGIIPLHQAAGSYMTAEKMRTVGEKSTNDHTKQHLGNEELVEGETSQFHTQDGKGRALFGYTTPVQARIESRSEDGTVRGSYSYLDAWGKAIKVRVGFSPALGQFSKTSYTSSPLHSVFRYFNC